MIKKANQIKLVIIFGLSMISIQGRCDFFSDLSKAAKGLVKGAADVATLGQCTSYEREIRLEAKRKNFKAIREAEVQADQEIEAFRAKAENEFKLYRVSSLTESQNVKRSKIDDLEKLIDLQNQLLLVIATDFDDFRVVTQVVYQADEIQKYFSSLQIRNLDPNKIEDLERLLHGAVLTQTTDSQRLIKQALLEAYSPEELIVFRDMVTHSLFQSIKLVEKLKVEFGLSVQELSILNGEGSI